MKRTFQDLKNQAAAAAKQSSKKGAKVSDATQKETLKGLQTARTTARSYLDSAKKEANTQYQNAQVACSGTAQTSPISCLLKV